MEDLSSYPEDIDEAQEAIHNSQEDEAQASSLDELRAYARLVHKICGYYKWSFQDFRHTPWWLIKLLSEILDERVDDLGVFIGYEEAAMFKNLRRMYPPSSS